MEIQPALHPGGIGLAQRRVRREFDARAQGEGACGHDDLAVITRHVPWLRRDKCVHGGALLHALAEGDQGLFPAQEDGLDDVRARLVGLGRYIVAELVEERGRKRSRFERFTRDMRRMERTHKQFAVVAERTPDLLAGSRVVSR